MKNRNIAIVRRTGLKQGIIIKRDKNNLSFQTKGGQEIGFIKWHASPGGKVLEIHNIHTETEFQRKGYGTYLVQEMIK